jgi:hypothetical protein
MSERTRTGFRLLMILILLTGGACLPVLRASHAQGDDRITYQGVTLRPGDIVNFYGGMFTKGPSPLTYGHSALYLGVDPQTGQRSFLDFTTSKERERPYLGRILPEMEFLTVSAKAHEAFDLYRLPDVYRVDQRRLLLEAKLVSVPDVSFGFDYVCATAGARVLSKATGHTFNVTSPDSFTLKPFEKHPQLGKRSINIQVAIREARAVAAADERAAQLRQLVPRMAAAQGQARRTALTAQEYATLSEVRRRSLLEAKWDYLRTLVGYACSDPKNLRTLNDEGRVPGVTLALSDLQAYVDGDRHLSRCEAEIFGRILASDGAASIQSLVDWGVTYRSQHGLHVALPKLLGAMKSFGAEVGRAFNSLGKGVGGPSSPDSSSDSSSSSGPTSNDSSSRVRPSDSSALRQLRGINASGIWPN